MLTSCLCMFLALPYVWANTEKYVFLGPPAVNVGSSYSAFDDLPLVSLNPHHFAIRTYLEVEPPATHGFGKGKASWFVLQNLTEDQRYEVRVCWAATQPTAFSVETYNLESVSKTPELTAELFAYAENPMSQTDNDLINHLPTPSQALKPGLVDSILFLRITALADFYTTNQTLMTNAPPVFVDIILDPFIGNALPRSLLPTVSYLVVVIVISGFVGRLLSSWVFQLAREPAKQKLQ
ncbi:hypothetical protein F4808DRAFT_50901 [Astrocystis sublimbata]|nr:hypothetical protein F4808DRAFT_50901 [Astrocystis sublimbata]